MNKQDTHVPSASKSKLADILAKIKARQAQQVIVDSNPTIHAAHTLTPVAVATEELANADQTVSSGNDNLSILHREGLDRFGKVITYNERQSEFISLVKRGQSCILVGAAGTGKTTCMRGAVTGLIQSGIAGIIEPTDHKYLTSGTPGIVVCAYTRRATNNIRLNMPEDMKQNCVTIHKLLQYEPVFYEVMTESGESRTTMRFEPARNRHNPLPASIHTIIIEEASMPSVELFKEIEDACRHPVQFIFLGDIQQLPPVFGSAILGFKMLELPVVELTEVYRQALESPIIRLAHRILSGREIPAAEFKDWNFPGQLFINGWAKKINGENAILTLAKFFTTFMEKGRYDPEQDMILMPFQKACGTLELNKHIANYIAKKNKRIVWEVIAGFQKHYFSIGETVMYDKEDAEILDIYPNPKYLGKTPQKATVSLDYWGYEHERVTSNDSFESTLDVDAIMLNLAAEKEDRVNQASHIIKLRMNASEKEILIDAAGEINAVLLGYALTVHKAQGSEWRRVFFCTHQSHATMIQRELMYTAVTRAREELFIVCEPDHFEKGIRNQRIIGNTLAEKAEFFKGKQKFQQKEMEY